MLRGYVSDKLLMWAMMILPKGSADRRDLAETLKGYLERSVVRLQGSLEK
jgi:hypothetical protein